MKSVIVFLLACMVGSIWSPSYVSAQDMGLGSALFDSLQDIRLGDLKVGLFYGRGTICVTHDIAEGASQAYHANRPDFAAFVHRRESDLSGLYVSLQGSLDNAQGTELLTLTFETNAVPCRTNWKQTTSEGTATGPPLLGRLNTQGRQTLAVLFLPDDREGEITMDNINRLWSFEALGVITATSAVDFLLGYKYAKNSSNMDPYSAQTPSYLDAGAAALGPLPGITNWENLWTSVNVSSTTGFSMMQRFSYHGPLFGLRIRDLIAPVVPGFGWNVDVTCAPFLWGAYEFEWEADADIAVGFVNGKQITNANGLKRFFLEVSAECGFKLFDVDLEGTARYSYLNMNGSEPQIQTSERNFSTPTSINQTTDQTIDMTQHFWSIGCNMVIPF